MSQTFTLLPTTSFDSNETYPIFSEKAKGSGYIGNTFPMHTVQYAIADGFEGSIKMQGTIVQNPDDTDWFDIDDTTLSVTEPNLPAATVIHKFVGLFVWVRASVVIENGTVNHIQYIYA